MRRRELLGLLFAAGALPIPALAQPKRKVWRIAFLHMSTREASAAGIEILKRELGDLGYMDGRDYVFELRYGDNDHARLAKLAEEIVQSKPDLILASLALPTLAAKKATSTIPIVFTNAGDPVGSGLVESLARPGGNVTGVSNSLTDIAPKHFDLLHETLPQASRVAVLMNPAYRSHRAALASLVALAPRTGVKVLPIEAGTSAEIDSGFALMGRQQAQALFVVPDAIFGERRAQIVALALKAKVPCIGNLADANGGFVLGYGPTFPHIARQAASLVDKVLRGARPADLPVAQPTRFELFVNLKAARAIGIEVPQSILLRADRVIE